MYKSDDCFKTRESAFNNCIPEAYMNKAETYLKLGEIENVKIFLQKGKILDPNQGGVPNLENLLSTN